MVILAAVVVILAAVVTRAAEAVTQVAVARVAVVRVAVVRAVVVRAAVGVVRVEVAVAWELEGDNMTTTKRQRRNCAARLSRRAYTLFEVMLSLALILVLMTIIGTALNSHLKDQFTNRMQVEEGQLARAILNRIADDIRAVLLDPDIEETAPSDDNAESDAESEDTPSDGEYDSDSSYYDDYYEYETGIVGTKKGIYGGLNWIQIDTLRTIPGERFTYDVENLYDYSYEEEYIPELDLLSCGQKTVLYYLGYDTGTVDADEEYVKKQKGTSVEPERNKGGYFTSTIIHFGLYYREMNRAIAEYALDEGLDITSNMTDYDEHLAPEVDNIEFAYYVNDDPEKSVTEGQWLEEWDMDAEGGELPIAIEIRLSIRRKSYKPTLIGGLMSNDNERDRVVTYSLVVPLTREMIDLSEVDATETMDSSL